MIQIEYLPIVLTGTGIMASILYYTSVLRNASKTRELQIFMAIVNDLNSQEKRTTYAETLFEEVTDHDDFMEKFAGIANPKHYGKRSSLWWTYNSIGILLKRGNISIDLVNELVARARSHVNPSR